MAIVTYPPNMTRSASRPCLSANSQWHTQGSQREGCSFSSSLCRFFETDCSDSVLRGLRAVRGDGVVFFQPPPTVMLLFFPRLWIRNTFACSSRHAKPVLERSESPGVVLGQQAFGHRLLGDFAVYNGSNLYQWYFGCFIYWFIFVTNAPEFGSTVFILCLCKPFYHQVHCFFPGKWEAARQVSHSISCLT